MAPGTPAQLRASTLPWCCRYSGGKEVLVIRGGGPLLLDWLKYRLTQSKSRGWVSPGPVGRWKSMTRPLKNKATVTTSGERRVWVRGSPDPQRREQAEDLRGPDPGPGAQQPPVEVGRTLRIQSFPPGAFDHPLQLWDVRHRLGWGGDPRGTLTNPPGDQTLQDGRVALYSVQRGQEHLEVSVATAPPSVPQRGAEVVGVCTQPDLDPARLLPVVSAQVLDHACTRRRRRQASVLQTSL